jgi:hypothetical protein
MSLFNDIRRGFGKLGLPGWDHLSIAASFAKIRSRFYNRIVCAQALEVPEFAGNGSIFGSDAAVRSASSALINRMRIQ